MTPKIFGIDDAVTVCDCCGKSGLKQTVIVEVSGRIWRYGSVCATKHTNRTSSEIKAEARAALAERIALAASEVYRSPEYQAVVAKHVEARNRGLIGKPFRDFCIGVQGSLDEVIRFATAKHGLKPYQIN